MARDNDRSNGGALARIAPDSRRRPDPATEGLAQGLGWLSLGLGAAEIVGGAAIARWLGKPELTPVIHAYGVREIVTGVGILGTQDPTPWIWGRVGGDAVDIATVLPALEESNPKRGNAMIALMALAGVTALDVVCAHNLSEAPLRPSRRVRSDYGRRSGFPESPEAMRGRASDFEPPLDIVGPQAMRPWTSAEV
ncbi:MAG: cyclase dehydrase [Methylobacteriaceae bacterium]|nr:cyclase dehydrase [Methylobacterium sp. Leaf90]